MKHYVIVGNGIAGTAAAEQIRNHDEESKITILTEEDLPFYYRIRLNEYISGDINEESLLARKPEFYKEKRINVETCVRVTDADPDKQFVVCNNSKTFNYDALLIATGSKSFVPPINGADKKGTFTLRTVDDARKIISYSKTADNVLLIGGGLLGLEAGNALRKKGKKVTVVEFFPRLLPRQLDEKGAAHLKMTMEDMGFSFRLGASTKEITGTNSVEGIVLDSGETLPCDMVIISAGVRPNLELGECLGLACNKGILVDSSLRTNRSDIYAAGDVAEYNNTLYGIWPAAMQQGKSAGTNMAGGSMVYEGSVMSNRLKVAGIELASAGEIDVDNKFDSQIEETETTYRKIILEDNRVIGCIMIGDTTGFNTINNAINDKKDIKDVAL